MDRRADLSYIARQLGFAACRVAPAHTAAHADRFYAWLEAGHHGDMAWLARDPKRRADPAAVLPGCQSVIVLATSYYQGQAPPPHPAAATGRIARYAWGDDYHDVITPRLHDLASHLADLGGTQKVYVDTGPVLERDFATAAGLGWNGKSTLQLDQQLGTWFFLSEIYTTLHIPPDGPATPRCGSCTRCIDACPTAAITAPHHLDATRCLSYLTIEHLGPIPEEFRTALGDRIYGCDDCLDACPWNRFAQASREAWPQLRQAYQRPLRDWLSLSQDSFSSTFRRSPIRRLGLPRFLRNVCTALGNVGTQEDLPPLRQAAASAAPLVAEHATWAIAQIEARHALSPPN